MNLVGNGLLPMPDEVSMAEVWAIMRLLTKAGRVLPIEEYCPWMARDTMREALKGLV